jgi:hypothetical protein
LKGGCLLSLAAAVAAAAVPLGQGRCQRQERESDDLLVHGGGTGDAMG